MNTPKTSASSSASQRKGSESRRSSASSSVSSTSCSLSVTSSIYDTNSSGWPSPPADRSRRYGFHRAATVEEKNIKGQSWTFDNEGRRIPWTMTRVRLPGAKESSYVVPVYMTEREQERSKVGSKVYSSPQVGRIISAKTFKEKKKAKRASESRTPPKSHSSQDPLPDEVPILQSWSPDQVFIPRTYEWISTAKYAGTFVSLD